VEGGKKLRLPACKPAHENRKKTGKIGGGRLKRVLGSEITSDVSKSVEGMGLMGRTTRKDSVFLGISFGRSRGSN